MTAQVWPFKQRGEVIESLEWLTDIFRAKAAEQRTALRPIPRRTFNLNHLMDDRVYAAARDMVRGNQGADGFYVPDWSQSQIIGAVSPGSSVSISPDFTYVDIGSEALLWESADLFEQVSITEDSGGISLDVVANTYTNARLVPLWLARCPEGLAATRGAAQINQVSVAMQVYENTDLSASSYPQYRSHDVMTSCPVVGSGEFDELIAWPLSAFDNYTSHPHYIRQRSMPDVKFQMRWDESTLQGQFELRQWLHSRKGRQKAFWLSSFGKDYEAAASVSGTTMTVYQPPGLVGLGRSAAFDIEIKDISGASNYRQVTNTAVGTPIGSRATLNLTLDSTLTITLGDIARVSLLRCARFDADRIEILHRPGSGIAVQTPCIEVPVP